MVGFKKKRNIFYFGFEQLMIHLRYGINKTRVYKTHNSRIKLQVSSEFQFQVHRGSLYFEGRRGC